MTDEINTGPTGGLLFQYIWVNEDPLSKHIAPRRYGRLEIDYGGDELAVGILMNALPAINDEGPVEGAWELTVSVRPDYAQAVAAKIRESGEVNVRVLS